MATSDLAPSLALAEQLRKCPLHNTYAHQAAAEIESLVAHIKAVETWHQEGEAMLGEGSKGLGAMFSLGCWWADRPWRVRP